MSRLILPQFKVVPPDLGTAVDRSLDQEEIDAAFAAVGKALGGGLNEENFASGLKFSVGATASTVQNAWAETKSVIELVGQATLDAAELAGGMTTLVLGGTGQSTWTPLSAWGLLLSDGSAPVVTLYYGASALTAAITCSSATKATYGVTSSKSAYIFSTTTFLQSSISANTLIYLTSTQPIYGVSTVQASFSALHTA